MTIQVLQHVPFEGPDAIADWAEARGHELRITRLYNSEPLPELADFNFLVVLGGPMSVHDEDEFPWLVGEKRLLAAAIEQRKAVLGICLGAQMMATVCGARVYQNAHKEIGWFDVTWNDEARQRVPFNNWPKTDSVFHWHGETFDLPSGATLLASSEGCKNQAFWLGERAVGLQFHLEAKRETAQKWIETGGDFITDGAFVQSPPEMVREPQNFHRAHARLFDLLDALVGA